MVILWRLLVRMKRAVTGLLRIDGRFDELRESLQRMQVKQESIQVNLGTLLSRINEERSSTDLQEYEFKVFSQWGEDGIIQHLINVVEIRHKTFIEFGIEDFSESNCRYLMMKDNWQGFVIDGSAEHIESLKRSYYYWRYQLDAVSAFITKENINGLLSKSGFDKDVGILSIDLDGNDYWILEALTVCKPRILICEYNAVFGGDRAITVPYDPVFHRTRKHYSNLYFGASLKAMTGLAETKGYSLVGTNSQCSNAFYVRNDLLNERLQVLDTGAAYRSSYARESRNEEGVLTFIGGNDRLNLIRGMPVVNVVSLMLEPL